MADTIIGQVLLEQFRVDAFIGAGGMGAVYRVWDLRRNVPLAMKVLHAELADDESAFRRFQREANALKKLAHPNIVTFYGLFRTPEFAFMLERFVDGPAMKDILNQRRGTLMGVDEALPYLKSLCAALGYAHASGVVHCDVKPGNVMLDRDGSIFLTDFGIARHAESAVTTYATAGAPAYMAPEQIRGQAVTPATDVYSLGVMFYELLTGQRPFRGDEPGLQGANAAERVQSAHLSLRAPDPRNLNPTIPAGLSQVLAQALEKDPARRYTNAPALFAAACAACGIHPEEVSDRVRLEATAPAPVQTVAPPHQPSQAISPDFAGPAYQSVDMKTRNRRTILWLLGAGGVVLVFVLAVFVFSRRMETPPLAPESSKPAAMVSIENTATVTPTPQPSPTPAPTLTPTPALTATPTLAPVFGWRNEVLQKAQTVGFFSNLVIDGGGLMHTVYFQDEYDLLWYGYEERGSWKFENIVGGLGRGFHASLALDEKSQPHIVFHNGAFKKNDHRVWYMSWTGKEWLTRSIQGSDAWESQDVSLALGLDGSAHFAYLDSYSKQIQYARHLSGAWDVQSVEPAAPDCQSFPIAVDAQGNPHMVYQTADGSLRYAVYRSQSWSKETVDPISGAGYFSDLVLDMKGVPHIAYYDRNTRSLKYATLGANGWITQVVDASGNVGQFPSIKVGGDGSLHISYYDAGQTALRYAYGVNGLWSTVEVDNSGDVGQWTSLALAADGSPRITYMDEGQGDIKLAVSFYTP